ncbi:MAG: DUF1016 N-terminal domain-containing protein [Xenococcaceae cyanobacterium MO_188.B32]|nr:DUF1016 N-terminal domain-containing protein [Xenococcaceae cyanobacterium MO_188.B32]
MPGGIINNRVVLEERERVKMSELDADNYGQLLGEIKQHIRSAQYEALKAVNQKIIALYWDIGKSIVTRQQGETWGKSNDRLHT